MRLVAVLHRVAVRPENKNWKLVFTGPIDDPVAFETQLQFIMSIAEPVVFDRGIKDVLEVWAEWHSEINQFLLGLQLPEGVEWTENTREQNYEVRT